VWFSLSIIAVDFPSSKFNCLFFLFLILKYVIRFFEKALLLPRP